MIALERILANKTTKANQLRKLAHDPLAFSGGLSWSSTLSWWFLGELLMFRLKVYHDFMLMLRAEVLPFAYYDLIGGEWIPRYWPPNFGRRRDIPLEADIHPTVQQMRRAGILLESDMPRLGGEEPYDSLPKWSVLSLFKGTPKCKVPIRVKPMQSPTTANGEISGTSSHCWSLDNVQEFGAKTWELV